MGVRVLREAAGTARQAAGQIPRTPAERARARTTRTPFRTRRGAIENLEINPGHRSVMRGDARSQCGAKTRAGAACQSPPVAGRKRCRLHGGLSPGAPRGSRNGNWRCLTGLGEPRGTELSRQWRPAAARLLRAYVTQVEALRRLRNGGSQTLRVEHVHVNEGGQALIGNVSSER